MSGCIMVPLALVGPATSGFSTASIMQTVVTQSANYIVKRDTGRTISEHAFNAFENTQQAFNSLTEEELKNTYFPEESLDSLKPTPQWRIIKLSKKN